MRAAAPVLLDDAARQALHGDRLRARRPGRPDAGHEAAILLTDFPAEAAERCSRLPVPGRGPRRSWSRCGRWAGPPPGRRPRQRLLLPRPRTPCLWWASPSCRGSRSTADSVLARSLRGPAGIGCRTSPSTPPSFPPRTTAWTRRPVASHHASLRSAGVMMKDALVRLRQRSLSSFDGLWKWRRRSPISRVIDR